MDVIERHFGEKINTNDIIVKIERVEYTGDGFKVLCDISNDSNKPISNIIMTFLLEDSKFEDEVNSLEFAHHVDHEGWIYKGEKAEGFYQWDFKRKIDIKQVTLNVIISGGESLKVGVFKA